MGTRRVRRWVGPLSAATLSTAVLCTTPLSGQTDWENRSPNPGMRASHALAFDMLRGRTVLFGGAGSTSNGLVTAFADTWEWDGTMWARRASANTPPSRSAFALAYDLARGRTVLFGGLVSTTVELGDTW